ncbi:hypothetical protein scyTo_0014900 [Scyliorhinus torazame]|uniref:Uncharacterized protein n=1 Tax=Scyliorhinus torazame TaxID=75743 RepID=A0A401NXB9_SCYTO|nr:hypothetical protein [Scyliorhinus torazame]
MVPQYLPAEFLKHWSPSQSAQSQGVEWELLCVLQYSFHQLQIVGQGKLGGLKNLRFFFTLNNRSMDPSVERTWESFSENSNSNGVVKRKVDVTAAE